ncbi:MAG: hypothetical protein ABSF22_25725 [Bryobacteraceae bacterium]
MPNRFMLPCLATAVLVCAQYTPPPQSYTVVQQSSLFGPDTTTHIYRDGSKVAFDIVHPGTHTRSVLDLQAHTSIGWDATQPAAECGNGAFSGNWGDPFLTAAGIMDDLNKQHPTPAGTETVNGVSTKVSEFVMEGAAGKSKVWVDPKYGMIMRILMAQPGGAPKVAFETTQMSFAVPPAAMFVPACKAAAPLPTDDDKIAAITGGSGSDYSFANKGDPPTNGGCMILFHIVRAGSMTPVTSGFQVFVDGKQITVLPNGLARLLNMPNQFNIDVRVPSGGATAPISRQCNKPQTTLLLVAKNWDKLGEGADWLWVKSGKLAGQ